MRNFKLIKLGHQLFCIHRTGSNGEDEEDGSVSPQQKEDQPQHAKPSRSFKISVPDIRDLENSLLFYLLQTI